MIFFLRKTNEYMIVHLRSRSISMFHLSWSSCLRSILRGCDSSIPTGKTSSREWVRAKQKKPLLKICAISHRSIFTWREHCIGISIMHTYEETLDHDFLFQPNQHRLGHQYDARLIIRSDGSSKGRFIYGLISDHAVFILYFMQGYSLTLIGCRLFSRSKLDWFNFSRSRVKWL